MSLSGTGVRTGSFDVEFKLGEIDLGESRCIEANSVSDALVMLFKGRVDAAQGEPRARAVLRAGSAVAPVVNVLGNVEEGEKVIAHMFVRQVDVLYEEEGSGGEQEAGTELEDRKVGQWSYVCEDAMLKVRLAGEEVCLKLGKVAGRLDLRMCAGGQGGDHMGEIAALRHKVEADGGELLLGEAVGSGEE